MMFKSIEEVKTEQDNEMLIENNIGLTKDSLEQYLTEIFSRKVDYGDTSILKIYHDKDTLSFTIGNHTTGILGIIFYIKIYAAQYKELMFDTILYNGEKVDRYFLYKLIEIENNL